MTTGEIGLLLLGVALGPTMMGLAFVLYPLIKKRKCWFRHDWNGHQGTIEVSYGVGTPRQEVVIAFKVCNRCAASRLIHLLQ